MDSDALYTCQDCGVTWQIGELTDGCPECGRTLVRATIDSLLYPES